MDLGPGPKDLYLSSSCPNIMTWMVNKVIDLGSYHRWHAFNDSSIWMNQTRCLVPSEISLPKSSSCLIGSTAKNVYNLKKKSVLNRH